MTPQKNSIPPQHRLLRLFFHDGVATESLLGRAAASPPVWILFGALCGMLDFWTGPNIQFPIAYAVPVALAAWHRGLKWAIPLALVLSSLRFIPMDPDLWRSTLTLIAINWAIRVFVLVLLALLVRRTAELSSHVTQLEGLLHVCAWCKRIRNDAGNWISLDAFVTGQPQVIQTHGICPECRQAFTSGH